MRNSWPDPKLTPGYSWVGVLLLMMLCRAILGLLAWAKQFPSHLVPKLSQTAYTDGAAASPPNPLGRCGCFALHRARYGAHNWHSATADS